MTDSSTIDFVGDFAFSSPSDGATPIVRARPMNYLFNRFSTKHKVAEALPPTHLFLSGGSLAVPAADDGSVAIAVAQCELQGEFGYVVELRTPYFRLFFDLDYISYRILSEEDAVALLRDAVLPVIAECYPHATPYRASGDSTVRPAAAGGQVELRMYRRRSDREGPRVQVGISLGFPRPGR